MAGEPAGFGELVRRYRGAAGLTQEELADRAGMSVRAVSDIERGRTTRPHRNSVVLLAEALGLTGASAEAFTSAAGTADDSVRAATLGVTGPGPLAPSAGSAQERIVAPQQLPAGLPFFAGRAAELDVLTSLRRRAGVMPGAVMTAVISGTAGVGKTALALQWAHLVAGEFPDGQLYVNLHGFDPSGQPVTPAVAVRGFLDALQVPRDRIPASPEAQADLYRGLVAGRRILIILDNARDSGQVRPLLPASPACLALVTSRDQMADLIAAQGAHPVPLDLLDAGEAAELLALRLGRERLDAEPGAAGQLIELCARLPLALSIAAARAVTHPHFSLASLISELRDGHRPLDALDWGEQTSLRAVFSWSYQQLRPPAARVFRLLGVHPGPDVTVPAAASLAAVAQSQARQALAELHRANLLSEPVPGRFAFHDLLRAYAGELAAGVDGEAGQDAARSRLLEYYRQAAVAATGTLFPAEPERRSRRPAPSRAADPALRDPGPARAWLDAERASLIAVTVDAVDHGQPRQAISMAAALSRYLYAGGYCAEAVALHSRTRYAARDIGDRGAEAAEISSLGNAEYLQGRYRRAADYHQQAVALSHQTGDRAAQARALNGLGMEEYTLCNYREAAGHWRQAIGLCREVGELHGLAITLCNLSMVELRLGHYQQAPRHLAEALEISGQADRDGGTPDIFGRAIALNGLGQVELRLGQHEQARGHLLQALASLRQVSYPLSEVDALDSLARVELALGRHQRARGYLDQALSIIRQTGMDMAEAQSVNSLGQVLLAAGHPGQARAEHLRALALAGQTGARYEQARAHDGLGHACQAAGDAVEAREHWQQALAIYTAIGVPEADTVRAQLAAAAGAAPTAGAG